MLQTAWTSLLPALSFAAFIVPQPSGPYGVSIQDVLITDNNLHDEYLNLSYQRVPVSVISEAGTSGTCDLTLQQYMPNTIAAFWEQALAQEFKLSVNNTLTQTKLVLCKPIPQRSTTAPVILFAPAAGISRYFYHILGSMITAKTGWTVIIFDSPGQTEIDGFPNGTIEYQAPSARGPGFSNSEAVANVTRDAIIVLDALTARGNVTASPAIGKTKQVAIMGHSRGGAAALQALVADARLSSGINLDGGLNASTFQYLADPTSEKYTTTKPFTTLMHAAATQYSTFSWPIVWDDVLKGTKWEFRLSNTTHDSYGDFPYLVDLCGIRQEQGVSAKTVDGVFGSLPGSVTLEIVRDLSSAFFSYGFGRSSADSVVQAARSFQPWGVDTVNQTVAQQYHHYAAANVTVTNDQ